MTTTERNFDSFVMKINGENVVKFNPSIVTTLFVVHKFIDTQLCYLLCNISKLGRFRKVSRCGITRLCDDTVVEDKIDVINDGRTKVGAFESATTMTVLFEDDRYADIKIFPCSVHICGLRDLSECLIMLKYVVKYFESIQVQLNSIYDSNNDSGETKESEEFFAKYKNNYPTEESMTLLRTSLQTDHTCCTLPVTIQSRDIVMTNYKGSFNTLINTRHLYTKLNNYPGFICYLSTLSNSNALNIISLEAPPFYPPKHMNELSEQENFDIKRLKEKYLSMSKRTKAQEHIKHSVFIYSSGKFIQSSRKNESSRDVMQTIVTIVMNELCEDSLLKKNTLSNAIRVSSVVSDDDNDED